jgi:hypothetical protein
MIKILLLAFISAQAVSAEFTIKGARLGDSPDVVAKAWKFECKDRCEKVLEASVISTYAGCEADIGARFIEGKASHFSVNVFPPPLGKCDEPKSDVTVQRVLIDALGKPTKEKHAAQYDHWEWKLGDGAEISYMTSSFANVLLFSSKEHLAAERAKALESTDEAIRAKREDM